MTSKLFTDLGPRLQLLRWLELVGMISSHLEQNLDLLIMLIYRFLMPNDHHKNVSLGWVIKSTVIKTQAVHVFKIICMEFLSR